MEQIVIGLLVGLAVIYLTYVIKRSITKGNCSSCCKDNCSSCQNRDKQEQGQVQGQADRLISSKSK